MADGRAEPAGFARLAFAKRRRPLLALFLRLDDVLQNFVPRAWASSPYISSPCQSPI